MRMVDAQADMRDAYVAGGPGVLVSGIVWLAAGAAVSTSHSPVAGLLTLFVGGMLIHPASIMISKLLGRRGAHERGNPLARLALESTFMMFCGLALAFIVFNVRSDLFFPAMLLVGGGRYLIFTTIYRLRAYWPCGGALAIAGFALAIIGAPAAAGAFAGGCIELAFAAVLFRVALGERRRALA